MKEKLDTFRFKCDECKSESGTSRSEDALQRMMERKGWLFGREFYGNEFHLCEICAAKPLPDWWYNESKAE